MLAIITVIAHRINNSCSNISHRRRHSVIGTMVRETVVAEEVVAAVVVVVSISRISIRVSRIRQLLAAPSIVTVLMLNIITTSSNRSSNSSNRTIRLAVARKRSLMAPHRTSWSEPICYWWGRELKIYKTHLLLLLLLIIHTHMKQ